MTYNIAFTPSAKLWSVNFEKHEDASVIQLTERSQLRDISSDTKAILIHLDPLKEFEKQAVCMLRQKNTGMIIIGWIAGQQLEETIIISLLHCGINAIITDSYSAKEITKAFTDAAQYDYHYNHLIGSALLYQCKKSNANSLIKQLDDREKKAIVLRRQGKTAIEIGDALHVSHKTIDKLFWKLYQRTGCRNFFELNNSLREELNSSYEL